MEFLKITIEEFIKRCRRYCEGCDDKALKYIEANPKEMYTEYDVVMAVLPRSIMSDISGDKYRDCGNGKSTKRYDYY